MTYDTKRRILCTGVYEEVKLTKLEHKLLICLSSGNMMTYEEMMNYLRISKNRLKILKSKLSLKTKFQLKINAFCNIGYKLKNEIYFK